MSVSQIFNKGGPVAVHRLSWAIHHQRSIPKNKFICHKCDNPCCVRPSHLFLGDNQINTSDRVQKGRTASGDKNGARTHPEANHFIRNHGPGFTRDSHPRTKLTTKDIKKIVELRTCGTMVNDLATLYNVSRQTINRVCRESGYQHRK